MGWGPGRGLHSYSPAKAGIRKISPVSRQFACPTLIWVISGDYAYDGGKCHERGAWSGRIFTTPWSRTGETNSAIVGGTRYGNARRQFPRSAARGRAEAG